MGNMANSVAGQIVGRMMDDIVLPALIILLISAALIYLIPAIVAFLKRRKDFPAILLINVLLGWTVVGWIVALRRAFGKGRRKKAAKRRKKR